LNLIVSRDGLEQTDLLEQSVDESVMQAMSTSFDMDMPIQRRAQQTQIAQ